MSTKEVSKNEETKTTSVADPDMKRNSGAGEGRTEVEDFSFAFARNGCFSPEKEFNMKQSAVMLI